MAIPTPLNGQITDAVTQVGVKVLADAPAVAMGNLYQATAQALANAAHNAAAAQQLNYMTAQAVTTMGAWWKRSADFARGSSGGTRMHRKQDRLMCRRMGACLRIVRMR
jgi:hypothetical protein